MSDLRKTLKEMAQLSLLANKISSVQEKNLRMFPLIFFDKVAEARLSYDLGHSVDDVKRELQHNSYIEYSLKVDESANQSNLSKRFKALEIAVRELFWKDIKVLVLFNGKLVYESTDV